jgi:hypothetical protein
MVRSNTLWRVLFWGGTLAVTAVINALWSPFENYLVRLTPISIWGLPAYAWAAMALTLGAATITFVFSVAVGTATGIITSAAELSHRGSKGALTSGTLWAVKHIRSVYDAFFVIPLVLTIILAWTLAMQLAGPNGRWSMLVLAAVVLTSGVALAGQRVFVAIADATGNAARDDEILSESVYSPRSSLRYPVVVPQSLRLMINDSWVVRFLVGCRISLLAQGVEQAFHLAVVGVVIAETVLPGLYELAWPQTGIQPQWLGGIGNVIVSGKNASNPDLIAGSIWLILFADGLMAIFVRFCTHRAWLAHYRSE